MSQFADSQPSFVHRALAVGLQQSQVDALDDHGLNTHNKLAYAVCGQPGQIDDVRFQGVLNQVFQGVVSLGTESAMRQLSYESITIAIAAIKQRVEQKDDKILPPQERDERLRRLSAAITGFEIKGELEPAHSVVDAYVTMVEQCCIKIHPLSKCISRDQELHHSRADQSIVTLENHQLQVKQKEPESFADLSTELRVQHAFTRRGLALHMAGLMTYDVHEKVTRSFMSRLTEQVPTHFNKPDIAAVLRADRELWTRAAERCRSNLKTDATGKLPLDVAMLDLYETASIAFFLLPTPKGSKRALEDKSDEPKPPKKEKKKKRDDRPDKGDKARVKVPEVLKGFSGVNKAKKRICYNYNLPHGCQNSTKKQDNMDACSRGLHQCIRCHQEHPLADCPQGR